MKKRFLASLLSLVMLLTMLPVTAFAAGTLEAITSVGTLSVTATKDSNSKLALTVKSAAEEGQEAQAVNAYSYLLHTAAVTADDYLSALNAESATPVAVTNGTLGDVTVTDGITHVIVYTVVADGETDAGKINAWACVEIKSDTEETPNPDTIAALTFTATKDTANKVTLTGTGDDASIQFSADNAKYKLGTESDLTEPTTDTDALSDYTAWSADITADTNTHIAVAYIENSKITKWGKAEITSASTPPTTYTITVDDKIQNGSVTVSPEGPVAAGTEVTVTPTADQGYDLSAITVTADGKTVDVSNDHKFTMPASNVTVSASFVSSATPTHTITVTESQNGTVATNPDGSAAEGATVTITATPDADYLVDTITVVDGNKAEVEVTDNTFTMPESDVTVTVTFKAVQKYTITIPTVANGTITTEPAGSAAEGTEVTIKAEPASGYKLGTVTVTKADNTTVTVENSKFTMPAENVTVTATFTEMSATEHTITIATATNGTVTTSPATAAEADSEVTINATADAGYEVDTTTVTKTGDANTIVAVTNGKFTMPAYDVTVTVTFKTATPAPAEKYTIKFAAGTGASGTMANVEVAKNASGATEYPVPACTFTAPTGKEFDVWTVTPSTVTITNGKLSIPADFDTATEITLTATWKPAVQKRYIVIAEGITNGTVTTNPPAGVVAVGTEVTVIATPADGYKLGAITVVDYQKNPVAVTGDKFTMPNSDVTVSATFVKEISITEEGNVSTDGNVTADIKPSDADLTEKIEEAKKATGDNQAVTFEVTVPETDKAKAETANVTLSKAAVKSVSDENLAVIVKTPVATVTVPAATMKDITSKADGNNVKMVVDKPKTSDVPATVQHVGAFDVRFEDSKGEVTVNKPLKLKMKVNTTASKVFVYLYKAGKAYFLDSATKQYDVVGGFVEFEVKHLSTYVAQAAKNDDATADKTPSVVTPLGLSIAKDTNGNHGLLTVTGTKANTPYLVQFKAGTSADATCMINVITATDTSFELYTTEPTATNSFVVEVWELKSADEPFVGKFGVANAVEPMVYGGKLFKAFGSGEEIK